KRKSQIINNPQIMNKPQEIRKSQVIHKSQDINKFQDVTKKENPSQNNEKGQIKADNYTHFKDEIWCNPVCFRFSTYLHKGPRTRINAGFFEKPASRIYM
ncbi:MAG: hypothetical protein IKT99_06665, partial [Oscillospiraceae bacterium]|nr:hypothetical protein [Oscillospiraceae bacterium]